MRVPHNLLILLLAGTVSACAPTYVERTSPQGKVPPLGDIIHPETEDLPRSFADTPTFTGEQIALDGTIVRGNRSEKPGPADFTTETMNRFSTAYRYAGKPRMAVFFNRALSEEVQEWKTADRKVVSGSGVAISKTDNTTRTIKGPVSQYDQTHLEVGGDRPAEPEADMWAIENAFSQPLLSAGAILIDRTTIMRLTAVRHGQGDAYEPITVKKIEMEALVNHADIFVEILLLRSKSAPQGVEYRAVAKEVRTGKVLANVTSLNKSLRNNAQRKKVVTTDSGYEIVSESDTPDKAADFKDGSKRIALDMMNSLTERWVRQ